MKQWYQRRVRGVILSLRVAIPFEGINERVRMIKDEKEENQHTVFDALEEGVVEVVNWIRGFLSPSDDLLREEYDTLKIEYHDKPFGDVLVPEMVQEILQLDYDALTRSIESSNFWPRDHNTLKQIVIDYGRSHYFFTDMQLTIPEAVHKFIFRNFGTSKEDDHERIRFFENLGVKGGDLLKQVELVTPVRSSIISRTKYEMLVNHLVECGSEKRRARELAIRAMALTTQHGMRVIKTFILKKFPSRNDPKVPSLQFCFFCTNVHRNQIDNQIHLTITFINYLPGEGVWQSHCSIPHDDIVKIRAVFTLNISTMEPAFGVVRIFFEGPHPQFGKPLSNADQGKTWGVCDFGHTVCIKYKDTSPTW
eukprot:TRINITY_DN3118_c0_g1_i11.p1 TRINITY_DN3118_c0_g1~~TRINITY_DN3118_c0_g1_i11.p1  ORF type:complete len:365 (-),score=42.29 TRINITY_DN3118_c0_g1_i11:102-1196(-)